jgi:uncharacterized protein
MQWVATSRRPWREGLCALVLALEVASVAVAAPPAPTPADNCPATALPGAVPPDPELQSRLATAATAQLSQHELPSQARCPDGQPRYLNRLILESSPYLQQHAFNPVNWYAWGDQAFAAAKLQDKPIFLSIGYSSCHWCHVMEHESFEDEGIARLLNERFVSIKVDREERPDLDNVYVAAVQQMTGGAGWPLTVFLTPAGEPFYGGTYFPRDDAFGKPGFAKLLSTIAETWTSKRAQVVAAGAEITRSLQSGAAPGTAANVGADTLTHAQATLARGFDAAHGGFGRAPKFPQAHTLQFLLRQWYRTSNAQLLQMVTTTLDGMARGGIFDQLGGGFHRYSTDAEWFVPHFEKMLYDQANNARAYVDAYQVTGDVRYADVARGVFTYVLRDLRAPGGAFVAAEDADSDGEEGRFYVWSRQDIIDALGNQRGPLVADFFGRTSDAGGKSVAPLRVPLRPDAFVQGRPLGVEAFLRDLSGARATLLAARDRRVRPRRDDKIVTAWNGLFISSLASAAAALNDPSLAAAGARAADFVLANLQRNGRLLRSYRDAASPVPGFLDDYASFIAALVDLYEATFDPRWLVEANRLSRDMLRLFADPAGGGLRYSASDHERLIATAEDPMDGALPSPQSEAALALLRLGRLTMNATFEAQGRALLAARSQEMAATPAAFTSMLMALDFAIGPVKEIVIVGTEDAAATQRLVRVAQRRFLPRSVIAFRPPSGGEIDTIVPFLKRMDPVNGRPTAYVCENYVCKLPTNDPQRLDELLTAGPRPE